MSLRRPTIPTGLLLWIIDPDAKLVHVYILQKDAERPAATYSEKDTFTSPHFPRLKIKGSTIFKR